MILSWYHNNLSYKFGQTLKSLTLQDSWNDLQFGMEKVHDRAVICVFFSFFFIGFFS
jgi:hypothetical protein